MITVIEPIHRIIDTPISDWEGWVNVDGRSAKIQIAYQATAEQAQEIFEEITQPSHAITVDIGKALELLQTSPELAAAILDLVAPDYEKRVGELEEAIRQLLKNSPPITSINQGNWGATLKMAALLIGEEPPL